MSSGDYEMQMEFEKARVHETFLEEGYVDNE